MILASKVDGVLVVIRPCHTRQSLAKTSMESIKLAGAEVIGVVLNRIPLRGADYYAGKSYVESYRLGYGQEREGSTNSIGVESLRDMLLSYTNKFPGSVKNFFEAVFKLSPKSFVPDLSAIQGEAIAASPFLSQGIVLKVIASRN